MISSELGRPSLSYPYVWLLSPLPPGLFKKAVKKRRILIGKQSGRTVFRPAALDRIIGL